MNAPNSIPPDGLLEALAELEHRQWLHWSRTVAPEVSAARRAKWEASWVAYDQLPEEVKEADRVWARQVVELLRAQQLIT